MDKRLLAQLNTPELLLWRETETEALASLDEDEVAALRDRIRRASNRFTGQHRREASARVARAHRQTTRWRKGNASSIAAGARRQARSDAR